MPQSSPQAGRGISLWPMLALVFLTLSWGYSWIFLKLALLDAGPFTFAAYRTMLAAIFLLALLGAMGRSLKPEQPLAIVLLGLIQTTCFVGLTMWALVEGGVGRTAILVFTMPFWTVILAGIFIGERIRGLQWPAVALAAVGLATIVLPEQSAVTLRSSALATAAGITWAASSVIVKVLQRSGPLDLFSVTAWQMVVGSACLLALAFLVGEGPVTWSGRFVLCLVVTGVVSTALSWVVWLYVLSHLSAGIAGLSMLATPVIALGSSFLHLGERPQVIDIAGMVLIAIALALLSWHGMRQTQPRM